MLETKTIIDGLVLPALLCALVLLASFGIQRFIKGQFLARSASALALGGAFIASQVGLHGWTGFTPSETWQWLAHLALAAALVALLTTIDAIPTAIGLILKLALAFAAIYLALRPIVQFEWNTNQSVAHLSVLTLVCFVYGLILQNYSFRSGNIQSGLFFICLAGSTALVLSLSGSLSLAILAGALAVALIVTTLLCSWIKTNFTFGPAVLVLVVLLASLWLNGHYYAGLTLTSAALLVGSGFLVWILQIIPLAKQSSWKTTSIRLVPALVPLAVAVILAALDFAKDLKSFALAAELLAQTIS